MTTIDCYWWAGTIHNNELNFGDILTPFIVRKLSGFDPVIVLDTGGRYMCSGSTLPDLMEGDIVWGSGVVQPNDLLRIPDKVKFCAVRGPLTRELLVNKFHQRVPEIYGDACLLIPKLFDIPESTKDYIGLVPHVIEYSVVAEHILPDRYTLINIASGFSQVISAFSKCRLIISSSLHGLMLADALGIPNVFAHFFKYSDMRWYSWKFFDYFLSVGRPLDPPADCSDKVDPDLVERSIKSYQGIKFDYGKFLDACPFNFTNTRLV